MVNNPQERDYAPNPTPAWMCRKCGASIGYLGIFIEWLLPWRIFKHRCEPPICEACELFECDPRSNVCDHCSGVI